MKRRLWIALGALAAFVVVVAVGFGPCVRSQIARRAERYGAVVEVDSVLPTFAGLRLRGVRATIAELPGVELRVERVVLGWRDQRPVSLTGGRVDAVGDAAELVLRVERWRARVMGKAGGEGESKPLELAGIELRWREAKERETPSLLVTDLRIARGQGGLRLGAGKVHGEMAGLTLDATGGTVELARTAGGIRVQALEAEGLRLEAWLGAEPATAVPAGSAMDASSRDGAGGSSDAGAGPVAPASSGLSARPSAVPTGASTGAPGDARPAGGAGGTLPAQGREARGIVAARRAYQLAVLGADRVAELFAPDAKTRLAGLRAVIHLGEEQLTLGPGVLSLAIDQDSVRVVLAPTPEVADARAGVGDVQALTFTTTIPRSRSGGQGPKAIVAELEGGPVWLSTLGVRDGDLGLRDVATTAIAADARVELPADGRRITVDGRGKLQGLALSSPRLAREPLEGIELGWRARAEIALDGSSVRVAEGAVDLGQIHLGLRGSYDRVGEAHRLDAEFSMPLVPCQQAFESIPRAMVPDVRGMRFAGSAGIEGHARFDTSKLDATFDLAWNATNSCRVLEAPAALAVDRLRKPFLRTVHGPGGKEAQVTLGPGSDSWTPGGAISRFMEIAVLTTEDSHFHRHHGFDDEAIVNSIRENIRAGRFVRGASTISMQLARNVYLGHERTLSRKLQEAILTLYLEQELTKNEIMELYLNVIEFGPMIYGVGPAARHYFHASPGALSLGQALYLSSILPMPSKQHFGAGGAVSAGWSNHLRRLMKIVHKTKRINDEELAEGLRETVVFGSPSPRLAPPESMVPEEPGVDDTLVPGLEAPEN